MSDVLLSTPPDHQPNLYIQRRRRPGTEPSGAALHSSRRAAERIGRGDSAQAHGIKVLRHMTKSAYELVFTKKSARSLTRPGTCAQARQATAPIAKRRWWTGQGVRARPGLRLAASVRRGIKHRVVDSRCFSRAGGRVQAALSELPSL